MSLQDTVTRHARNLITRMSNTFLRCMRRTDQNVHIGDKFIEVVVYTTI